MHNFRELEIWKKSKDLSKDLFLEYKIGTPNTGNIVQHLLRTSVSIPSNIAEGSSRKSTKDFSRFLDIALGSAYELETQLLIAFESGVIHNALFIERTNEIQRMIFGFQKKILTTN